MMLAALAKGFGLGIAGAGQPGPFQAFLIAQTMRRGWRRALPCALAPLITDGPIIALVLIVLDQVPAGMRRWLHIASALVIGVLAAGAIARLRRGSEPAGSDPRGVARSLLQAIVLNATNPGPYIFWSAVAGPALMEAWAAAPANAMGFLAAFYTALIGGFGGLVIIFGTAARFGPRVRRILLAASAVALVVFAIWELWLGLHGGRIMAGSL
ncbi:MAG: LysE family transporter [Planctomycetes bacterium]|nr:LysE family transporter [Planctomycetota bacterium]